MNTDRRGFIGALMAVPFVGRFLQAPTPIRPMLSASKLDEPIRLVLNSARAYECQWTEISGKVVASVVNIGSEDIRIKCVDFGNRRITVERGAEEAEPVSA